MRLANATALIEPAFVDGEFTVVATEVIT